jgi:hypothetical protein
MRALAALVCSAVLLAMPAAALASRGPRPGEARAIMRAAGITDGGEGLLVRVRRIRVSTAAPWATANVAIYQSRFTKHAEQVEQDSFYRAHGRWLDTNNASTPQRNPPAAVRADLSLPSNTSPAGGGGPSVPAIAAVALIVVFGVGLLISKLGDRGKDDPQIVQPPRPDPVRTSWSADRQRPKCGRCNGTREVKCPNWDCQGNGWWYDENPNHPGQTIQVGCWQCQRSGKVTCPDCQGSGFAR